MRAAHLDWESETASSIEATVICNSEPSPINLGELNPKLRGLLTLLSLSGVIILSRPSLPERLRKDHGSWYTEKYSNYAHPRDFLLEIRKTK